MNKKNPSLVNRKGVMFHQDNSRSYTARNTSQKSKKHVWEKISHPISSPNFAPLDYHLFRSLKNHLEKTEKN